MAKKPQSLSFVDIVMGAEADIIKQAYEARIKIDDQLAIREEAYRRIAEVEEKVEEILGEQGEFIFPAPPLPVAGFTRLMPASRPRPKKPTIPKPVDPKADEKKDSEDKKADAKEAEVKETNSTIEKNESSDTSSNETN